MIHHITYNMMPQGEQAFIENPLDFQSKRFTADFYKTLHGALSEGYDTFIFIVTTAQLPNFRNMLVKYDLEQFIVLRKDGSGEGTTNHLYQEPRKLKLFILQGKNKNA